MRTLSLWGIILMTGAVAAAQPPQPTLPPTPRQPPGLRTATPQPPQPPNSQPPSSQSPSSPPSLSEAKLGDKSLGDWITELRSTDASVRSAALQAVGAYGSAARKALPRVIYLLSDFDHSVRTAAVIALGNIGVDDDKDGHDAVNVLRRLLNDGQGAVRIQAILTLAKFGPKHAHPALPQLTLSVRDNGSWEIRKTAVFALSVLGRDADNSPEPSAIGALARALEDRTWQVRLEAAHALIHLGPTKNPQDTQSALTALTTLIQQRSKDEKRLIVQIWARVAMMRLDGATMGEANLAPIARSLSSPEQGVRLAAAQALGTMGAAAKSKVQDLAAALQNTDLYTVAMALWALGQMGTSAASVSAQVEPLTHHKNPVVKAYALETMRRLHGETTSGSTKPPTNPGRPGGR